MLDSREAYVWVGEYQIVAVSPLKNVFVGWEWIIIILKLTLIAAAACIAFFCKCGGEGFSCVSCVSCPHPCGIVETPLSASNPILGIFWLSVCRVGVLCVCVCVCDEGDELFFR